MRTRNLGRRVAWIAVGLIIVAGAMPGPVSADDGAGADSEFEHVVVRDPGGGFGPTSDCRFIPPVHHRMYGIRTSREGDGDENTIWGMEQTYKAGGRWFETDLQTLLTKEEAAERRRGTWDGRHSGPMVLFHDYTLDRTTNETGVLRQKTYDQLPRTTTGRKIPTLNEAFKWISEHPGTHLLIEIKMPIPWRRVNALLDKYGFTGTNRVIFDTAKVDLLKVNIATHAQERLNAITGVKDWPPEQPASYLAQFGTSVRVTYDRAVAGYKGLVAAGIVHRFSKVANGWDTQKPEEQWTAMVTTGVYRYLITERTAEYLAWCRAQQPGASVVAPVR